MPARSLRIIFSVSSPFSSIFAASKLATTDPPALPRSLWHVAQYCLTIAVCSAASIVDAAGACDTAGFTAAGLQVRTCGPAVDTGRLDRRRAAAG